MKHVQIRKVALKDYTYLLATLVECKSFLVNTVQEIDV